MNRRAVSFFGDVSAAARRSGTAFIIGLFGWAPLWAVTVEEAYLECFAFVMDQDTAWFDERWPGNGNGMQGDDRIGRFIEAQEPIRIIEAGHLRLDQGDIVTTGSDCGVFVAAGSPEIEPAFTVLLDAVAQNISPLSPVTDAEEGAYYDGYTCFEGRDFRLWLTPTQADDTGDAYWMRVRHLPDFGRGCELQ